MGDERVVGIPDSVHLALLGCAGLWQDLDWLTPYWESTSPARDAICCVARAMPGESLEALERSLRAASAVVDVYADRRGRRIFAFWAWPDLPEHEARGSAREVNRGRLHRIDHRERVSRRVHRRL